MEGRKEPSILRCFFLLLSSLQVKTCPSRCWCRFFYRLKRTYFCFLRQSHLRKPFALHIADAVKGYLSPIKRIICPGISSILRTSPITETQHLPAFLPSGRKHTKSPRGIPQEDPPTLAASCSEWMGRLLPARSLWPSAGLFYPVNFFLRRRLKMDVNAKMSEAATGL